MSYTFCLENQHLTRFDARSIASGIDCGLITNLSIRGCEVGDSEAVEIAKAIRRSRHLARVVIDAKIVSSQASRFLTWAIRSNPKIEATVCFNRQKGNPNEYTCK
jgi:hypothetical protein